MPQVWVGFARAKARPMTGSAKQSIVPAVIANSAKQSIGQQEGVDCFVAPRLAMTWWVSRSRSPHERRPAFSTKCVGQRVIEIVLGVAHRLHVRAPFPLWCFN